MWCKELTVLVVRNDSVSNQQMVKLKRSEIRAIEESMGFPNGHGYVLDFSDRTIAEFFEDEFGIDFDDPAVAGDGSKRVRLTNLLQNSEAYTATKILRSLWDRREGLVMRKGQNLDQAEEFSRQNVFMKIIQRIDGDQQTPSTDGIDRYQRDRTLEELIADIERSLRANKPEAAMDHLHTYCMKKFAHLLATRNIECGQAEALHARMGKYRRAIASEMEITEFTDRALKSTISLFDAFNEVRNFRSLAHDNPILEPKEARFIFESICTALRFIRAVEAGRYEE